MGALTFLTPAGGSGRILDPDRYLVSVAILSPTGWSAYGRKTSYPLFHRVSDLGGLRQSLSMCSSKSSP